MKIAGVRKKAVLYEILTPQEVVPLSKVSVAIVRYIILQSFTENGQDGTERKRQIRY